MTRRHSGNTEAGQAKSERMATSILIADDDSDLVEGLCWYLEAEGFQTTAVDNGSAVLDAFRTARPDVVILDIMMPGMDGVQVCEQIRRESNVYIIMLSARDGEIDKVRALEKGADDYITKPFYTTELVARIKALLRRSSHGQTDNAAIRWMELEVFPEARQLTVHGISVLLSALEFDLLMVLLRRPRAVLSRAHLADLVWGNDFNGELRLVDTHIYRLREKLTAAGSVHCPIVTVRGVGYAFRPEI